MRTRRRCLQLLMGYDTFRPNLLALNGWCLIVILRLASYTVGSAVDFKSRLLAAMRERCERRDISSHVSVRP